MLHGDTKRSGVLPFPVIRDKLDTLLEALTNLLDRQFPKELEKISGLQPFLLVTMKAARNT